MFVDGLLTLAGSASGNTITGEALYANGSNVLSTNTIDLGVARDIGEGDSLFERVEITTAFTGGTSAEFQVIGATNAALSSGVVELGTTGAIPVASLVAGARFVARINPQLLSTGVRYLGMQCVNVGNNTAGAAFVDIGPGIQDGQKDYASGFVVL